MITLRVPGARLKDYVYLFPAEEPFLLSFEDGERIDFTTLQFLRKEKGHEEVRLAFLDGGAELEFNEEDSRWHMKVTV